MRDIKAQAKLIASAARADVDCRDIPVDLPKTEKGTLQMIRLNFLKFISDLLCCG